jgi:hypothetical protein
MNDLDLFIVGFSGDGGSIDPLPCFKVSDDCQKVSVTMQYNGFFGSGESSQEEPAAAFLKANRSFYIYDTATGESYSGDDDLPEAPQ